MKSNGNKNVPLMIALKSHSAEQSVYWTKHWALASGPSDGSLAMTFWVRRRMPVRWACPHRTASMRRWKVKCQQAWFFRTTVVPHEMWDARTKGIAVFVASMALRMNTGWLTVDHPCCWFESTIDWCERHKWVLGYQLFMPLLRALCYWQMQDKMWTMALTLVTSHHYQSLV